MTIKIGIATGYTSQNIGNAFFQLGGTAMLKRAAALTRRSIEIEAVPDAPGNWTLHVKRKGNPDDHFNLLSRIGDLDLLVIQGPSLSWHLNNFWSDTLSELQQRGTQIALLGIAFYRFDYHEYSQAREFLQRQPVLAISTRDRRSAEILHSLAPDDVPVYDGLDSGFWLSRLHRPPPLTGGPYIAMTFDRYPEPHIQSVHDQTGVVEFGSSGGFMRFLDRISRRGKAEAYASALIDRRRRPRTLGAHTIIRPEHRSNPPMHWKAYGRPNGLMADEPWSYLTVYANADITISDRVHACVAALSYGNRAVLLNNSPRGGLLDRVHQVTDPSLPRSVSPAQLETERSAQEGFVARHVLREL